MSETSENKYTYSLNLKSTAIKILAFLLAALCISNIVFTFLRSDIDKILSSYPFNASTFTDTYEYKNELSERAGFFVLASQLYSACADNNGELRIPYKYKNDFNTVFSLDQNGDIAFKNSSFDYYIKTENKTLTNIPAENVDEKYLIDSYDIYYSYDNANNYLYKHNYGYIVSPDIPFDNLFTQLINSSDAYNFTLYIAPKAEFIAAGQAKIDASRGDVIDFYVNIFSSLFVFLICFIYLLIVTGSKPKQKAKLCSLDKMYTEFTLILLFLSCATGVGTIAIYREILSFINYFVANSLATNIIFSILCGIIFSIAFIFVLSLIRKLKCRQFIKTSLIYKLFAYIIGAFTISKKYRLAPVEKRMLIRQIAFYILIPIVAALFGIFASSYYSFFALFFFIALICLIVLFSRSFNKDIDELSKINSHIDMLYNGYYDYQSIVDSESKFSKTEQQLNNISSGFKKSVDRQLASERMKIDLVTNVSHDLKTPLTSIIGYIDLLKKQPLDKESLDYIAVLEQKANRLNDLVRDLFTLAKATSGAEEIETEKIDCVILLNQVLADMNDKIEAQNVVVKPNISALQAIIDADGKKLYRVLQNLIDNALKYSLDGSRIFIDLSIINSRAVFSVKNVASYEMDFKAEEISERFTRGDKARSTEGNGLGLAIAKSFVVALGGIFSIKIDGDLFKVTFSFPLTSSLPDKPTQTDNEL